MHISTYEVRHAFRTWVAKDLTPHFIDTELEAYGGAAHVRIKLASNDSHFTGQHPVECLPPRWKFCLVVDEDCVRSLDTTDPVVKLLTTEWLEEGPSAATETWTQD